MLNLLFAQRTNPGASMRQVVRPATGSSTPRTLAQAHDGQQVTITGFGKLSAAHRQHLQAYGLLPGRTIRVLAQRPVTIVLVEQTELAFETEIAQEVFVA